MSHNEIEACANKTDSMQSNKISIYPKVRIFFAFYSPFCVFVCTGCYERELDFLCLRLLVRVLWTQTHLVPRVVRRYVVMTIIIWIVVVVVVVHIS